MMLTDDDLTEIEGNIFPLIIRAGEIILGASTQKDFLTKDTQADLVTATDKQVEAFLFSSIKNCYDDHHFIGEESIYESDKCELTNDPTWIIDPVDGTTNFVHGFPFVAVSVGFLVNRKAQLGFIYAPYLRKMYKARHGKGAVCIEIGPAGEQKLSKTLSVAHHVTELKFALLCCEIGSDRDPRTLEVKVTNLHELGGGSHGVRSLGSAALNMCAVASGMCNGYVEYGIHCWDVAAGELIVREAGGVVSDPDGSQFDVMSRRVVCACTKELCHEMMAKLTHLSPKRDDVAGLS